MLLAAAAPFVGLGEKEEFILHRLANLTRTDVFRAGALVTLVTLAGFVTFLRADLVQWLGAKKPLRPAGRVFERVRSYYSFPQPRPKITFHRGDQVFLLLAAFIFQAFYLVMIPLVFECDAAMYYGYARSLIGSGGAFTDYRPPGFPLFLIATGQTVFDSFIGTVIVQAAMGILASILVYRSLAPMHRYAALICAVVFILSTIPFTAAKLMLATQLFLFLVIAMIYSFSRYYFGRDARFIHLVVFLGFAAMFTRWEAQIPLLFAVIALVLIGRREAGHLRHVVLAISVVAILTASYSYMRSYALREPALFGSLHNGMSRQLFWRVYSGFQSNVMGWEHQLGIRAPDDHSGLIERHLIHSKWRWWGVRLVDPANGPATRRLRDLIAESAAERPEAYRRLTVPLAQAYQLPGEPRRDLYHEAFGQFDGRPEALAENFFKNPNDFYRAYMLGELINKLGIYGTDKLLRAVVLEAFLEHPVMLLNVVDTAISNFGLNLRKLVQSVRLQEPLKHIPVFGVWGQIQYANVVFNMGGCARNVLPPSMIAENLWDSDLSYLRPYGGFIGPTSLSRSLVRNTAGVIVLVTWWFLPFSAHRIFLMFLAGSTLSLVGVTGLLGGGAFARYEYVNLTLILITTTGALVAMREVFRKLHARVRSRPEPQTGSGSDRGSAGGHVA